MKKLPILIFLVISIGACVNLQKEPTFFTDNHINTKSAIRNSYLLSDNDIDAYIDYLSLHDEYKDNKIESVTPIQHKGINVFYIINFEQGWIVLSCDKRGPVILAKNKSGQFDLDKAPDEEQSWFESIANQIVERIQNPNDYYRRVSKQTLDKETNCVNFWRAINAESEYIKEFYNEKEPTRSPEEWRLSRACDVVSDYEFVDHLIPVCWHQGSPFNAYCPLTSQYSTTRCPAGCAPVAVGQTLFYLHYYLHRPKNSPTTGSCVSWVGNYSQDFSDFESYTWNNMGVLTDSLGYAALLLGYLGKGMHIHYHATHSGTDFQHLHSFFASDFGLHYLTDSLNIDTTYDSIKSGLPVICVGTKITAPADTSKHAFILDGYLAVNFDSLFEYTNPSGERLVLTNQYDYIPTHFRINWGRGIYGRTSLYALTGTWDGYDYERLMVYDFMTESK